MKVRMNETVLGSVGGVWSPRKGDEIEVSDEVGALLCSKKIAEPVVEKRVEKAVPKTRNEVRESEGLPPVRSKRGRTKSE